jgi:hypothetical protein
MIENKQRRPVLTASFSPVFRAYGRFSRLSAGRREFAQRPQQLPRLRRSQSQTKEHSRQGLPAGASCLFGTNPLPASAGQPVGSTLNIQASASARIELHNAILLASDGAVSDQMSLTLNVADFTVNLTPVQ